MTHAISEQAPPKATRSERSPGTFRADIQGLRAIAVVLVILAHAGMPGFEGGYIGVDVFFVISGFVITGLLVRQAPRQVWRNLGQFYARRVRRIVPAATVVLVATVFAAYELLGPNFDPSVLSDARWASLFSANFRLINTHSNYFIPGISPSLVTHYWSLAVEEQFYLFFPLIVFGFTWLAAPRHHAKLLATFLVAAIVLSAWWSYHLSPLSVNPTAAYYSPFTRFWELALGGLVALVPVVWAQRTVWINELLAGLAVVVIAVSAMTLDTQSIYPGLLAWWPCGATAVLLLVGPTTGKSLLTSWLTFRPVRYVGDISYSLYLYHFAWLMLPLQLINPITSWWAIVIEIAGATACAAASYHLLENPIRHSRSLDRDPAAVILVLLICLAITWNATWLIGHWAQIS